MKPRLDKLGGKGFARRKEEVEKALFDISADLLDLQAEREQALTASRSTRQPTRSTT